MEISKQKILDAAFHWAEQRELGPQPAQGAWRALELRVAAELEIVAENAVEAQKDANKAGALLQLIDEFRERLPSSFLTLVDAARAGREE